MSFSDHVYATKHGVDLELRVFPARVRAGPGEKAPWLFWSHGGAFLFCYHHGVVPWVHHAFKAYHIVSWSYRLAPIAAMADMAEDGLDAYAWCRAHLPAMLDIDLEACAVGGDSAGGCLATLLGGLVSPAPRAVLADQAITDLADAWFDGHPDPPAAYSGEFTHAEIAAAAHDRDLAHAIIGAACYDGEDVPSEESLRNEFGSNSLKFGRPERLQLDVRRYLASRSRWVRSVAHPEKYDEEGVRTQLRKWPPVHRLENTPSYPPTFFVHGEEDECVPARQSRDMAARLRQMGVHVGEHYEPSAGHCFNQRFGNDPSAEGFDRCVAVPFEFVDRHVRRL